jgi:hypothetical protein
VIDALAAHVFRADGRDASGITAGKGQAPVGERNECSHVDIENGDSGVGSFGGQPFRAGW